MCPCSIAATWQIYTMSFENQSAQACLHEFIEKFWEILIAESRLLHADSYGIGSLYYQRGRYFLTKMEQSLQNVEVQPLRNADVDKEINYTCIPIVQTQEDDPPSVQFHHLCQHVSRNQIQSQSKQAKSGERQQFEKNPHIKNNVSYNDFRISKENIEEAIRLFEYELKAGQSQAIQQEIKEKLSLAKAKRAIIHMIGSDYSKAASEFRGIISELRLNELPRSDQLIAQYTFLLGNCLLLSDEAGCQGEALSLFMKALNIYLEHLHSQLNYDTQQFSLPLGGVTVDRLPYLSGPDDPREVKIIKEVMSIILDKIEDVHQLISIKKACSEGHKKSSTSGHRLQTEGKQLYKMDKISRKKRPEPPSEQQGEECKQEGGRGKAQS